MEIYKNTYIVTSRPKLVINNIINAWKMRLLYLRYTTSEGFVYRFTTDVFVLQTVEYTHTSLRRYLPRSLCITNVYIYIYTWDNCGPAEYRVLSVYYIGPKTRWCLEPRGLSVSRHSRRWPRPRTTAIPTGIHIQCIYLCVYIYIYAYKYYNTYRLGVVIRPRIQSKRHCARRGLSHLNSDKPFWTRRYYTVRRRPRAGSITAGTLIIYPRALAPTYRWADHRRQDLACQCSKAFES